MRDRSLRSLVVTFVALTSLACSDTEAGKGSVAFTTWGEDFIEKEIPASSSADAEGFVDGWSVKYEKFLVTFRSVKVADQSGAVAAEMKGSKLFDMVKPGIKPLVRFDGLEAKAWDRVSYEISPAAADTELAEATQEDKALMVTGGYSVYVRATATKGAVTKKLGWGFTTRTVYDRCEGELGGKVTPGVVVTNGGVDQPELTIHGDHFFYDDLQAAEAKLRFDALASADADNDGNVTLAELANVKLAAIPKEQGPFGTGSASNVNDLAAFVTALSRTVGHFRGEGECFAAAR